MLRTIVSIGKTKEFKYLCNMFEEKYHIHSIQSRCFKAIRMIKKYLDEDNLKN